ASSVGRPPPAVYTLSLHDALPIFRNAFLCRTFPLAVMRNRLAAPRWVFILTLAMVNLLARPLLRWLQLLLHRHAGLGARAGLGAGLLGRGGAGLGGQNQDHLPPFQAGLQLHLAVLAQLFRQLVEHLLDQVRMDNLPTPETHTHLHLVACLEKALGVAALDSKIMLLDLRAHPDLFDGHRLLPLAVLPLALLLLIPVAPEVHDPADGRLRVGSHLDQVQVLLLRQPQRLAKAHDAQLGSVRSDETHLTGANLPVHAQLPAADRPSPPLNNLNALPASRTVATCLSIPQGVNKRQRRERAPAGPPSPTASSTFSAGPQPPPARWPPVLPGTG